LAGTLPTIIAGFLADKLPITYLATILGVFLMVFAWALSRQRQYKSGLDKPLNSF
jgi:hypothetical protein